MIWLCSERAHFHCFISVSKTFFYFFCKTHTYSLPVLATLVLYKKIWSIYEKSKSNRNKKVKQSWKKSWKKLKKTSCLIIINRMIYQVRCNFSYIAWESDEVYHVLPQVHKFYQICKIMMILEYFIVGFSLYYYRVSIVFYTSCSW